MKLNEVITDDELRGALARRAERMTADEGWEGRVADALGEMQTPQRPSVRYRFYNYKWWAAAVVLVVVGAGMLRTVQSGGQEPVVAEATFDEAPQPTPDLYMSSAPPDGVMAVTQPVPVKESRQSPSPFIMTMSAEDCEELLAELMASDDCSSDYVDTGEWIDMIFIEQGLSNALMPVDPY